ncbi:MAG: hypothetical protein ACXABY_29730, partial [Candidatus Thorarchaeota archaeon]
KIVAEDLMVGIKDGTMGQADIHKVSTLIRPQEVIAAERLLGETVEKKNKADLKHADILNRVTNGDGLEDFTPGAIQKSFNRVLDQMRVQFGIAEGEPLSLSLKASAARVFKGRIKSLENEMEHALTEGGLEEALEALNAYRILSQENPEFTRYLHQNQDKSGAIAAYALQLVDKTDVPEQAAIARARTAVLNADDVEHNARGRKFNSIKEFKPDNITETARSALGGDPFFGFDRRLAPGVADEFNDLAREQYILTGDKDSAIESAANQMKQLYGETEFNGGRLIMFAPPEKMFPGISSEKLQGMLGDELQAAFPGINPAAVEIVSDDVTRIKPGFVSYGLQIRDEFGNAVPLLDPNTGQLLRWELNQRDTVRDSHLEKARTMREGAMMDREMFGDLPEDTVITEGQRASMREAQLLEKALEEERGGR